jgi:hypothetical protein
MESGKGKGRAHSVHTVAIHSAYIARGSEGLKFNEEEEGEIDGL